MPKHRSHVSQRSPEPLSWLPNLARGLYWLVRAYLAAGGHWPDHG